MIESIWNLIKNTWQFIWAFIKGAAIGLWNSPTLLIIMIAIVVGGFITTKLFRKR